MLALGYTPDDLCRILRISPQTLRTHVYWILTKTGLKSRTLLVTQLWASGLVDSSMVDYVVNRSEGKGGAAGQCAAHAWVS